MTNIMLCGAAFTHYERTKSAQLQITGFDLDYTGWHVREKIDGVSAFWTGDRLIGRGTNLTDPDAGWNPPEEWVSLLPNEPVIGELMLKENHSFSLLSGIARRKVGTWAEWQNVVLAVYDVPINGMPYWERAEYAKNLCDRVGFPLVMLPELSGGGAQNNNHLAEIANQVLAAGGEGVVIYEPNAAEFIPGDRRWYKKIVGLFREEAIVLRHNPGGGKFTGMLGTYTAVMVEAPHVQFSCSGQMNNEHRMNPHPIGTVITVQHKGRERDGYNRPRMPQYVGERLAEDMDPALSAQVARLRSKYKLAVA